MTSYLKTLLAAALIIGGLTVPVAPSSAAGSTAQLKKLDRELDAILAKKKKHHHRHHHRHHAKRHHKRHKKGSKITQMERQLDRALDKKLGKK